MNAIQIWMQTPAAAAVGWTLIHFLWQGTAIALLLAAVLALLGDSRARYGAACAGLAAMTAAPAITLAVLWPSAAAVALPIGRRFAVNWAVAPGGDSVLRFTAPWYAWIAPCWFAGALAVCAWRAAGWFAAQRMRTRGVCAVAPEWQSRLADLAAELRVTRPVRLLESCLADVPVAIGWLRPVILLPVGLASGLRTEQVEALLLHELAHIRRCDYLVNLLQTAIESLLFYHPAVWWVSNAIRTERENCCDDLVVRLHGDARAYAATLATLETARCGVPLPAVAATGGRLIDRVRRLTNPAQSRVSAAPVITGLIALATIAAALVVWPAHRAAAAPSQTPATPASATAEPQSQPAAKKVRRTEPAPVLAQVAETSLAMPEVYRKWLKQDVVYIITDAERSTFETLRSNSEREHFIEQFWERRDPTPGTIENEFKEEHYRRIAYANQHFAPPSGLAGWKTDRGRVYIVYGPPDEIEDHRYNAPPSQQWLYKYIADVGKNVIMEFKGDDYRMTMDPSVPHNVFFSTGQGPRVIVEVQPDRSVVISVPLGQESSPYVLHGEITTERGRILSTFEDVLVGPEFKKTMAALQPGTYDLQFATKNTRGERTSSHVTFTVQ